MKPLFWIVTAFIASAAPAAGAEPAFLGSGLPDSKTQMAVPQAPRTALSAPAQTMVSQDPLSRQILIEQVTRRDGGVTGFVRLPSGQGIELKDMELGAAPSAAKPAPAATAESRGLPRSQVIGDTTKVVSPSVAPRRPAKAAGEQLKVLDRQGRRQNWSGEAAPVQVSPRPKKPAPAEELY